MKRRWWHWLMAGAVALMVAIPPAGMVYIDRTDCAQDQQAWDNRADIISVLTEQVEYPPTVDPELVRAQDAANKKRVDQRARMSETLGNRPDC